jgi:hypothetical protein
VSPASLQFAEQLRANFHLTPAPPDKVLEQYAWTGISVRYLRPLLCCFRSCGMRGKSASQSCPRDVRHARDHGSKAHSAVQAESPGNGAGGKVQVLTEAACGEGAMSLHENTPSGEKKAEAFHLVCAGIGLLHILAGVAMIIWHVKGARDHRVNRTKLEAR